jgi:hypothetical protein
MPPRKPPASATQPTRKDFAAAVHEWVRAQKSTLQSLAARVGIGYESLRQDVSKGRFHLDDAIKIAAEIGLPSDPEQLEAAYEFKHKKNLRGARREAQELEGKLDEGSATPGDVLRQIGQHIAEPASTAIPKLFSALGEDCILALFLSTEIPAHWEPREAANWMDRILQALDRGARIVYLYPHPDLAPAFKGTGFRQLNEDQIKESYESFRRRLEQAQRRSAPINSRLDNIYYIAHRAPVLCTPGLRYVLYIYPTQPGTGTRASVTIENWTVGGKDAPEAPMVISLGKDTAKVMESALEESVLEALRAASPTSQEHDRLNQLRDAHFGL